MFGLVAEDFSAYLDRIQVALFWPDLHIYLFPRHLVFLRSFFLMKSDIKSSSHLFEEQKERAEGLCNSNAKFTLRYIKAATSVKRTIVTRFLLFVLRKESKELKFLKWCVQDNRAD